jgi:hypothetical protein
MREVEVSKLAMILNCRRIVCASRFYFPVLVERESTKIDAFPVAYNLRLPTVSTMRGVAAYPLVPSEAAA